MPPEGPTFCAPRGTHLHLRVVRCHPKAHQAERHELLLVDVHLGPGVVLGERAELLGASLLQIEQWGGDTECLDPQLPRQPDKG